MLCGPKPNQLHFFLDSFARCFASQPAKFRCRPVRLKHCRCRAHVSVHTLCVDGISYYTVLVFGYRRCYPMCVQCKRSTEHYVHTYCVLDGCLFVRHRLHDTRSGRYKIFMAANASSQFETVRWWWWLLCRFMLEYETNFTKFECTCDLNLNCARYNSQQASVRSQEKEKKNTALLVWCGVDTQPRANKCELFANCECFVLFVLDDKYYWTIAIKI